MYKRNTQGWLKHIDFIIVDAIILQIAYMLAYMLRHGKVLPYATPAYSIVAVLMIVVDILVAAIFNTMHNVMKRGPYLELVQTLKQVLLNLAVMTIYMFTVQSGDVFSRITIFLTALFHLILGYFARIGWKQVVKWRSKGRNDITSLLVAEEGRVQEILDNRRESNTFPFTGLILINRDGTGEQICGLNVVAGLEDAADYIVREWVDEVFIYPEHMADLELEEDQGMAENDSPIIGGKIGVLIEQCRQMSVSVHIRFPINSIRGKAFAEKIGGYNVLTVTTNYATPTQLALKRLFDILGGLVGSLIALVIIAIVGPRIKKESPGPILFKQTRIGKNGKKFQIYKLRSMYMDAEERKKELAQENRVSDGMMFKMDFDPRIIGNKIVDGKQVTGIGEKIRSASLDEFPQFFNVLLGQMSLVGTRPPTVDEWEKYKYHHRARLAMKPGITGMWQVSGRSKITDFEEVVRLDTEYIDNWSMELDLRILFKTVKVVFKKDGAM